MRLSCMLPCLCVLWSGEGCRVEINVKLTEPVVYIWGERRKVGGAEELDRTEQRWVCVRTQTCARTVWGSCGGILRQASFCLEFTFLWFQRSLWEKREGSMSKRIGSWKVAWPGLDSRASYAYQREHVTERVGLQRCCSRSTWIQALHSTFSVYFFLKLRFNFFLFVCLEQFQVHSKLRRRYREFPYNPYPQTCIASLTTNAPTRLVPLLQLMNLRWRIIITQSP